MTTIISLIRGLIEDISVKGKEPFTYEAEKIFTITESHLIADSIKVFINNTETSDFTADYDTCKVTVNASLSAGDVVEIQYNYYVQYSDTELKGYINSALSWLSICKYENADWDDGVYDFTIGTGDIISPVPTTAEKRLIAIIAGILSGILPTYRTPDFGITIRDSESKEEKIRKVIRGFKSHLGIFEIIEKDKEDNV